MSIFCKIGIHKWRSAGDLFEGAKPTGYKLVSNVWVCLRCHEVDKSGYKFLSRKNGSLIKSPGTIDEMQRAVDIVTGKIDNC